MGWKETDVTSERMKFVTQWQSGGWSMTELCAAHGVSRKTGYKLINRYLELGLDGLKDQSRAPRTHPNATSPRVVRELLRIRKKYGWGGKKTIDYLARRWPPDELPAPSTVDEIFRRHGLVKPRRRRTKRADVKVTNTVDKPNDRWCADFKGWFRTRDGSRCDPLTITDSASRYLLRCAHAASLSFECVKPHFSRAFRDFGLPASIRTDNGSPFASTGIAGLSRLSVWFVQLGIYPDFIEPGKPQQNGRHERMHRTLKKQTARPPKASLRAQQRAFDRFRAMYNNERPHEGIDGKVPADLYRPARTTYTARLPPFEYASSYLVRKVQRNGTIKLEGTNIFLGAALRGHYVGLKPEDECQFAVQLGAFEIARLNSHTYETLLYRKPVLAG